MHNISRKDSFDKAYFNPIPGNIEYIRSRFRFEAHGHKGDHLRPGHIWGIASIFDHWMTSNGFYATELSADSLSVQV